MKKSSPKLKQSKKIIDEMLRELWQNALLHEPAYQILESIVKQQSKKSETLPEKAYFELSTIRNRNLVSIEEQRVLRKTVVAFFGLSVGSHAALTWMMESRADVIKIADPDTIKPSNLNRLRFDWKSVERRKVDVVEEQACGINPFAKVIKLLDTDEESMRQFCNTKSPVDIIVDEIDDLRSKVLLRKIAKERKIPLLCATDVGDNVLLDIERYDLNPAPKFFLGRVPGIEKIDFARLEDKEKRALIIKIVGFKKSSEAMLDSLLSIGETIVTWPQLGATATIAGSVITTAMKKIVLGEKVLSGRYCVSLDDIMVADFSSKQRTKIRSRLVKKVKEKFDIEHK